MALLKHSQRFEKNNQVKNYDFQEKKRLEEVEDSLQQALLAGKQREAQLNSEIESKEEFIHKLDRKNAEMVRRLHQFDLEKVCFLHFNFYNVIRMKWSPEKNG